VIVTLRPEPGTDPEQVSERVGSVLVPGNNVAGVLLDAPSKSGNGGLGELSDWNLARDVAKRHPVMLAGGLNPENVRDAINTVRPIAVDLSSGVETNREKDPEKILRFASNARAAFSEALIG
jgi:phosphoribosylanthranilate isomerase